MEGEFKIRLEDFHLLIIIVNHHVFVILCVNVCNLIGRGA